MPTRAPRLLPLNIAVLLAAAGYGVTFPLLAVRLEQMGASGWQLGLNAAVPAVGWILGSAVMPRLQARYGIASVTLGFLVLGLAGFAGVALAQDYWAATAFRFIFGGGVGLFFRAIEYWINGVSSDDVRGRNLSVYNVVFMLGIVVGSALQPALGADGWLVFAVVGALLSAALLLMTLWPAQRPPPSMPDGFSFATLSAVPVAFLAILAYGLYESIPVYLTEVYALRNGLGNDVAAFTLTAAAIGNILFPIPIAVLSDRTGRLTPLVVCALTAALSSLAIPFVVKETMLFLALIVIAAGAAGTIYSLALAMIGDRYQGAGLAVANATFGIVYAAGSIAGPLVNGLAIDTLQTHGIMVAAAAIFGALLLATGVLHASSKARGAVT